MSAGTAVLLGLIIIAIGVVISELGHEVVGYSLVLIGSICSGVGLARMIR